MGTAGGAWRRGHPAGAVVAGRAPGPVCLASPRGRPGARLQPGWNAGFVFRRLGSRRYGAMAVRPGRILGCDRLRVAGGRDGHTPPLGRTLGMVRRPCRNRRRRTDAARSGRPRHSARGRMRRIRGFGRDPRHPRTGPARVGHRHRRCRGPALWPLRLSRSVPSVGSVSRGGGGGEAFRQADFSDSRRPLQRPGS